MLRTPRLLPGLCLLVSLQAWAEPPATAETAPPTDDSMAAEEVRPPLPERSVTQAQTLEQRLDKREQQTLQAGDEAFLALWLPANVGEPNGAVILLPGDAENADDAQAVGPLRHRLPDAGWHSLSLSLPDPDGDAPPLRLPAADTRESEAAQATDEEPDAAPEAAQQDTAGPDREARREAHAQRVLARIEAAIAFARQQQASTIVLLGHGSGAYWAARYLAERQTDAIQNLLLVAATVPAGFAPALEELVPQLAVATGDFYYQDRASDRQAALRRLQASKRLQHPTYIQVAMKALPGNPEIQQQQLYRRLRGWLSLNISATAPAGG